MRGTLANKCPLLLVVLLLLSQLVLAPDIGRWVVYVTEWPDEDSGYVGWITVVDGDTIRLGNGTYVRLVGYDAYELNEPRGLEAKQALENLTRKWCYVDIDDLEPYDQYGRKLGYIWCLDFMLLIDPPVFPSGLTHYVNVNKWFLTYGKSYGYVKRELYIPPDEHPWWTWLTRHRILLKGFYPGCQLTFHNMSVFSTRTGSNIESYSFYGDYELNVLSGFYHLAIAYYALNLTYVSGATTKLISTISTTSEIDVSRSFFYALFVRGSDNRTYYTVCNYSACSHAIIGDWNDFKRVNYLPLSGSTIDAPSAATSLSPYGSEERRIHLVVRGGGDSIWYGYLSEIAFEPGKAKFRGWQRVSGSTPSRPAITADSFRVYLVVRGRDNGTYYNTFEGTWLGWRRLPSGSTIDAPAAVFFKGKLHIVVRGSDGHSLWHSWVDPSTGEFSGWFRIPGSTPSAPYMTTDGEKLYLAVRGRDNRIYFNVFDGSRWLGWTRLPTGSTVTTPAIFVSGDFIHFVVVGMDGKSIYYASMNLITHEFTSWVKLPGSTPSSPALISLEN